ncbi:ABC transporter permease [Streptomyces sp. NPDC059466]|uniref:ABC transporter permease n=1 Tax=Streptomyces sp. NPDC059466 TaxID=3346843 RepID=UPI0036B0091F
MQPSSELPAITSPDGTLYDPDMYPAGHRPAHGRHALADTEPGIPAPVLDAAAGVRKAMLVPVVTALAIGTIFVAVYLAAFHAPSARHQPLGIAASDTVAARTELALNSAAPDAYTFHRYADADAARRAIVHDEVPAALVGDAHGMRLLAAGAQGPSVVSSLASAATEAGGPPGPVRDVRPLAAGEARGRWSVCASVGVGLAGFLFAVSSYQIAPRLALSARAASMLLFAAASGVTVALIAHSGFGALPAPFLTVAVVVGLLAWATAAATGVLLRLFGPIGMPVASVLLLILGNATSGGILPATFLPGWLVPLADLLAPAAAIQALRDAAYFDNAHLTGSLSALVAWVVGCLALQYLLDRVAARREANAPSMASMAAVAAH